MSDHDIRDSKEFVMSIAVLAATLFSVAALGQPSEQPPAQPAVASDRPLLAEDVFDLERAGDPRISPDGRRIVYTRLGFDVLTDATTSELWIIDADGSNHQRLLLLEGSQSEPRWSPGGDRIAFIGSHEERRQIFMHWLDTGRTGPISRLTRDPSGLAWSPDGEQIAFSMFVPDEPAAKAELPKAPEGADWGPEIEVEDRLNYRLDGRGSLEPGRQHLFVIPADGGSPRRLTEGDHDHRGPFAWTPDGSSIVLSANRRDDKDQYPLDSDLHRVDVESGVITQLTDRFGPDASPAISPDGTTIAYTGFDDRYQGYQPEQLYLCDLDGLNPRLVTGALDREVATPTWATAGDRIYFKYDSEGRTRVAAWFLDPAGQAFEGDMPMRVLVNDLGGLALGRPYPGGSFTVADTGDVAYTLGVGSVPAEIAVTRTGAEAPKAITRLNQDLFADVQLGAVEDFWVDSTVDDTRVQGWIVYPPAFDPKKTYPLILEIHGGPFANYGARFSAECQLFAAAGYVVVYTNPRGSTSYGGDFGNAIHHAYPGNDYHDLMDCVDHVIGRGFIDTDRLFVTGGSGGGVLTAWIVGNTDRFRAAVVQKPVINWYSFVLYADVPAFFYRYWFPGPPWEHERHYMDRSPISLVGNVTTPTMLITGSKDLRTPLHETEQYYTALRIREVPTKLVRVPDAYHGIAARPSNLIAKVAEILSWFKEHDVKTEEGEG